MDKPTDPAPQNQHRPQNRKINHKHHKINQKLNTPTHEHTNKDRESIFVNLWLWVGAWKLTRMSLGACGGDRNVWVD